MSMINTERISERFWKAKSGRTLKLSTRPSVHRSFRRLSIFHRDSTTSRQSDCVRSSISLFPRRVVSRYVRVKCNRAATENYFRRTRDDSKLGRENRIDLRLA